MAKQRQGNSSTKRIMLLAAQARKMAQSGLAQRLHETARVPGVLLAGNRRATGEAASAVIDWHTLARSGISSVKKFQPQPGVIMLLVDISRSCEFGSGFHTVRDVMNEIGSLLACSAAAAGVAVGLILFSDRLEYYLPPSTGDAHILHLITKLCRTSANGLSTDPIQPIEFINRSNLPATTSILISDLHFNDISDGGHSRLLGKIRAFRRHHQLIAIMVNDPRMYSLPDCGRILLEDAESSQRIEIDSSNPEIRRSWQRLSTQHADQRHRLMTSAGVELLSLSTDRPYLHPVLSFFGTRARRLAR